MLSGFEFIYLCTHLLDLILFLKIKFKKCVIKTPVSCYLENWTLCFSYFIIISKHFSQDFCTYCFSSSAGLIITDKERKCFLFFPAYTHSVIRWCVLAVQIYLTDVSVTSGNASSSTNVSFPSFPVPCILNFTGPKQWLWSSVGSTSELQALG